MSPLVSEPFESWLETGVKRAEAALDSVLMPESIAPSRLHEAMRYAALNGGKRIRPLLAFATGETCPFRANRIAR